MRKLFFILSLLFLLSYGNLCEERYKHVASILNTPDEILYHICSVNKYSVCVITALDHIYLQYCELTNKPAFYREDLIIIPILPPS